LQGCQNVPEFLRGRSAKRDRPSKNAGQARYCGRSLNRLLNEVKTCYEAPQHGCCGGLFIGLKHVPSLRFKTMIYNNLNFRFIKHHTQGKIQIIKLPVLLLDPRRHVRITTK
jgi:hypothetical protein